MQSDLCLDEIFFAEVWEVNQEKPGIKIGLLMRKKK